MSSPKSKRAKKVVTPEQAAERRKAARERRWKKTGVSAATVAWMKSRGML